MILNKDKYLHGLTALPNSKVARWEYILSFSDPQRGKNVGLRAVKNNQPSLILTDGSSGCRNRKESRGCPWLHMDEETDFSTTEVVKCNKPYTDWKMSTIRKKQQNGSLGFFLF